MGIALVECYYDGFAHEPNYLSCFKQDIISQKSCTTFAPPLAHEYTAPGRAKAVVNSGLEATITHPLEVMHMKRRNKRSVFVCIGTVIQNRLLSVERVGVKACASILYPPYFGEF